jgi:hypothetical protein
MRRAWTAWCSKPWRSLAERQAIADEYKQVAGFDPRTLNARASYSVKQGFIRAG